MEDTPLDLESITKHFRTEVFDMKANTDMSVPTEVLIPTAAFPVQSSRGDLRSTVPDCKLCGNSHPWYTCPKYPKASQKIGRARALKIFTSCLSKDDAGKTCTNSFVRPCRFCKNKHYSSLCLKPDRRDSAKNHEGHDKSQNSVDSATN